MTPQQQAQIDYILDRFDFERVHRAMVALDWKWHKFKDGTGHVPSKVDLKLTARKHLAYVVEPESSGYMSSGGFVARRDGDGCLSLTFELERESVRNPGQCMPTDE